MTPTRTLIDESVTNIAFMEAVKIWIAMGGPFTSAMMADLDKRIEATNAAIAGLTEASVKDGPSSCAWSDQFDTEGR